VQTIFTDLTEKTRFAFVGVLLQGVLLRKKDILDSRWLKTRLQPRCTGNLQESSRNSHQLRKIFLSFSARSGGLYFKARFIAEPRAPLTSRWKWAIGLDRDADGKSELKNTPIW